MSDDWEPSSAVLATLPCPWSELSPQERAFVTAMWRPTGTGETLAQAAQVLEDALAAADALEGATRSLPVLP
ncbi:hypothetical protein [Actinacidiphila glaucinigra]|uniref:hypothetical protein n=1 Tax=Actinacidiphila glaucinigra TaxID=235986 RepID=UPI003671AB2C